MLFHPKCLTLTEGTFVTKGEISATAHPALCRPILRELWQSFTFGASSLRLRDTTEGYVFSVGDVAPLPLDGYDFSLHIEKNGLFLLAKDERSLLHGYLTLLDRFYAVDMDEECAAAADGCALRDRPSVPNRMVHFCIFPEVALWELHRFVRFAATLKYTHIVLEFWGTLHYDCLKELSWESGFTKDEIRPIVEEANALGLEVIPMFNHWGHASASRAMHGKHVVLDQNPSLATYFREDGWCWDYRKPKVRELLGRVREELIELCGEGSYFHLGCDEALPFDFSKESIDALCDYIGGIATELRAKGRRAIVWGDMFLYRHPEYEPKNNYTCAAPSAEVERYFLSRLDRSIVIADWEYWAPVAPVETASVFQKAGFDTLLCPSDVGAENTNAALSTVTEQSLMGFLHTTWHTLSRGMPYVTAMATGGYDGARRVDLGDMATKTAAHLRKVMPARGVYERAGWSKQQIDFQW